MSTSLSSYLRQFLQIYQRDEIALASGLRSAIRDIDCGDLESSEVTSLLKSKNKKAQKQIRKKTLLDLAVSGSWNSPNEGAGGIREISTEQMEEQLEAVQKILSDLNMSRDQLFAYAFKREVASRDLHTVLAFDFVSRLDFLADFLERADETDYRCLKSEELRVLFREAHICYLNGSFVAAILICGAILEHTLNLLYPQRDCQASREKLRQRAIEDGKLDVEYAESFKTILKKRDDAAHEPAKVMKQQLSETSADLLLQTRLIVRNVFKVEDAAAQTAD